MERKKAKNPLMGSGRRKAPTKPSSDVFIESRGGAGAKKLSRTFVQLVLINSIILISAFLVNLFFFSPSFHTVSQQKLFDEFQANLQQSIAPTGERDYEGYLLQSGTPVAYISASTIGLHEVVVEGTDSTTLRLGAGHRRDTVLPGQVGTSVILGRQASYGGPFANIQQLSPGDMFVVTTGQGEQKFRVLGVRTAGEYSPPTISPGQSRLILISAAGAPYAPSKLVRVDAELVEKVQPAGSRFTSTAMVPAEEREMGIDLRTLWQLLLALQLLLAVEIAGTWAIFRFGLRKAWIPLAPITVLTLIAVMDQLTRLLPNLT